MIGSFFFQRSIYIISGFRFGGMFLCNSQVTSFRTFFGGAEFWRSMFVGTCVLNYTWNWWGEPPGNRKAQETEIRKREKSSHLTSSFTTLQKFNIAMENGPFEDVFPIQNGDIPASYVSLPGRVCYSSFREGIEPAAAIKHFPKRNGVGIPTGSAHFRSLCPL